MKKEEKEDSFFLLKKERLNKKHSTALAKIFALTILGSLSIIGIFFGKEGLQLIGVITLFVTFVIIMFSDYGM